MLKVSICSYSAIIASYKQACNHHSFSSCVNRVTVNGPHAWHECTCGVYQTLVLCRVSSAAGFRFSLKKLFGACCGLSRTSDDKLGVVCYSQEETMRRTRDRRSLRLAAATYYDDPEDAPGTSLTCLVICHLSYQVVPVTVCLKKLLLLFLHLLCWQTLTKEELKFWN